MYLELPRRENPFFYLRDGKGHYIFKEKFMEKKDVKIEVKIDEATAQGAFANYTNISHNPDEFLFDFLFVHPTPPPGFGKLISRLILTPGHAKRLLSALQENIQKYENQFGKIEERQAPSGPVTNIQ